MKRTAQPLRLDLVIRTSQRRKDGQSPDQQRQVAAAAAAAGGNEIVAVHDSGRSESGKTMDRAAVRAAQQRIRAGQTDGIVVGYLDRLGRAPIEESMSFVRELVNDGGVLVAADWSPEPIDLTEPNAETVLVIRLQMNREQWTKAKQRYRLSQTNAVAAGKFIGPTPLGYCRKEGVAGNRLVPDLKFGPVITEAYLIAARDGLHAAMDHLAAQVPDRVWSASATRRLLRSRVYLGEVWMLTDGVRTVNENAHEALTSPELFDAAQTTPRARRGSGNYPLSNLVVCEQCGEGLTGQLQKFNDRGIERTYRRYRCSNKACGQGPSIDADKLEAFLREMLERALADKKFRDAFAPQGLDDAQHELDRAERDRSRWADDDRARDLMGEDAWFVGLEKRASTVKAARARYSKLASQGAQHQVLPLPEELSDPVHFERALRALFEVVTITILRAPGRVRVPIADRINIVITDKRDDVSRALAA